MPKSPLTGMFRTYDCIRRSAHSAWFSQGGHDSAIPGWAHVLVAFAAIIPILYLLFRNNKAKVFLEPTEFQDLPLQHKEASFGLIAVTSIMSNSASTMTLLLMSPFFLMSSRLPRGRKGRDAVKVSLHGPTATF